jgi:hypothetical protein
MEECVAIAEIECAENVEEAVLAVPQSQSCVEAAVMQVEPDSLPEDGTNSEERDKETTDGNEGGKTERKMRKEEECPSARNAVEEEEEEGAGKERKAGRKDEDDDDVDANFVGVLSTSAATAAMLLLSKKGHDSVGGTELHRVARMM